MKIGILGSGDVGKVLATGFLRHGHEVMVGTRDSAKLEVATVLDQFGWDVADMGKAEAARAIEPLCMLWCIPGFLRNEWTHAFALLKS